VRASGGLAQLVLGGLFWSGRAYNLIPLHIVSGLLVVFVLWTIAVAVPRGGSQSPLERATTV
jgi:hypothetical protein